MAFSTLINYFRKLFENLGATFRHVLAEITTEGVPRKKLLQILDKKNGKEWPIGTEKNMEKLPRSRLLDYLLFHIKKNHK